MCSIAALVLAALVALSEVLGVLRQEHRFLDSLVELELPKSYFPRPFFHPRIALLRASVTVLRQVAASAANFYVGNCCRLRRADIVVVLIAIQVVSAAVRDHARCSVLHVLSIYKLGYTLVNLC